jgi:hypothetical protein
MNISSIHAIEIFRMWPVANDTTVQQSHYYTITFDPPVTLIGQIFLNAVSLGGDVRVRLGGAAAAAVLAYTYIRDGQVWEVRFWGEDPVGHMFERNVTSVTWVVIVRQAWASAHGTLYVGR